MSDSLRPHGPQHTRPPCLSPIPGVYTNSCPLSWWCQPIISSSLVPFSSCLQSFPASGSFQMSQLFPSGGQNIGASASVFPMNIQGWFLWELTDLISLQSKVLSRFFSKTTVQRHLFFGAQSFLLSTSHIHTTRKTIALTRWTLLGKVVSLLFNMLFRFVIAFLPRNESFNFMTCRCIAPISASVTAWPWILCLCLHVAVSSPYNERTLVLLD